MEILRIHPSCSNDEARHDKSVKDIGYCSTCGKQMPIDRLRILYREYKPSNTGKLCDRYSIMKSMSDGIKQRADMKPLPITDGLDRFNDQIIEKYSIDECDQVILMEITEQVRNLESKTIQ